MLFHDSVEIDEIHHPIRVETRRIIPDSEGAGPYRGAPGVLTEFGPVDCDIEVGYVSDGTINPARVPAVASRPFQRASSCAPMMVG